MGRRRFFLLEKGEREGGNLFFFHDKKAKVFPPRFAGGAMRILQTLCCLFFLASPVWAQGYDLTGEWRGKMYGSEIVAELVQNGNFMSGVVTVFAPFGGETIYHVQGAVFDNGHMYVLHGAGHVFEGDFTERNAIGGVLTLKGGRTVELRASRRCPGGEKDKEKAAGGPQGGVTARSEYS